MPFGADHDELRTGLALMTKELVCRAMDTDWSQPDEVQHADRLMRFLSAYGRNIEKCIAMTDCEPLRDINDDDEAEAERLREIIYRKLVRYADRLGEEELARRVELDRAEAGSERVALLGEDGSIPPEEF